MSTMVIRVLIMLILLGGSSSDSDRPPRLTIRRRWIEPGVVDSSPLDGSPDHCHPEPWRSPNYDFDSYHFPHRRTIFVQLAGPRKRYVRFDKLVCLDLEWELSYADPGSITPYEHCAVRQPKGCEECDVGFQLWYSHDGKHQGCRLQYHPKLTGDAQWARQVALPRPQYCPSGMRRNRDTRACSEPCPPNCIRCRNLKCEICAAGYHPSIDSEICEAVEPSCKPKYFKSSIRCLNCPGIGCKRCEDITGHCLECARGRLLVISRFRRRCVLLCPYGTYLDYTTYKCLNCPSWCRHCDGIGCLRCSSGLYGLHDGAWRQKYIQCHHVCPDGYYPHNAQPLHCRRCDPACEKCYGPSNRDCLSCRASWPQIEQDSRVAFCPSHNTGHTFELRALGYVCSESLRSEETLVEHVLRKTGNPQRLYPGFCKKPNCLANCEGRSLLSPCPSCVDGYAKDMHGYCVKDCPEGSLFDTELNVCIQCTHPSKCKRCEWRPGAKRTSPDIPYQYPDDPADPDSEDRQICLELFRPEHLCNLSLHYLDANNTCVRCHPECKGGCTGEGSSVCKACLHAMDLDGHCIAECPPRSRMNETLPGWWTCMYIGDYDRPEDAQFPFNRRYYWDAISHRRYLVIFLGIFYIFFQVLGMTGAWYLGEPGSGVLINWRDEEEVRQDALDHLEHAWLMRSKSSSSGRPLPFAFSASGSRRMIDYENDPLGNPLLMVVPVFIRRNLYPKLKKQGKKLLKSIESRSSSLTLSLSRSLHSGSSGSQSQERRPTMSSATGTTLTPTTATPTTLTRHTTGITGTMAPTTDPSASRKSTKSRHSNEMPLTEPTASGYPSLPLEETISPMISETQHATEVQPSVTPDEPSQATYQQPEEPHSMSEEL